MQHYQTHTQEHTFPKQSPTEQAKKGHSYTLWVRVYGGSNIWASHVGLKTPYRVTGLKLSLCSINARGCNLGYTE